VTIEDKEFVMERQPILITNREENSNKADYLVFLDAPSDVFIKEFARVFYFFEEAELENAKKNAKKIKPTNSYKKEDGKWIKNSL
jgi:hypothetical protein